MTIDVLCVGHACYDLVFSVPKHPQADEKTFASGLLGCGGGPAANAAIAVAKLGCTSAFAGYLGNDLFGTTHYQEFVTANVNTDYLVRGDNPTPLSTVIVKPDGQRALINYKGQTLALTPEAIDFSGISPKVVLFDGHEPQLSLAVLAHIQGKGIATVLDAGSVHDGTRQLMDKVDFLVCSEKFAVQWAGDVQTALSALALIAPAVVITLGESGLIWQRGDERGSLPALAVKAIDTTGAGDAFHGAFAAALALGMDWLSILRYASVAGSLCCTQLGARPGLPSQAEHAAYFANLKQ